MKFSFRTGLAVAMGMSLMAAPASAQLYGQPYGTGYGPAGGQAPNQAYDPGAGYRGAPSRPAYGSPQQPSFGQFAPQGYAPQQPYASQPYGAPQAAPHVARYGQPAPSQVAPARYPLQGAPTFQGPAYPASYGYVQDEAPLPAPVPAPDPGVAPAPANVLPQASPSDQFGQPIELEPYGPAPSQAPAYHDHEAAPYGSGYAAPQLAPHAAPLSHGNHGQLQSPHAPMQQQGVWDYPATDCGNAYDQALSGNWRGTVWDDASGCGTGTFAAPARGVWFGGVYGLIMNRSYETPQYLSYDPGMPSEPSLTSTDADLGTLAGFEVAFGRQMCNGWAWQASYWGLMREEAMARDGNMPNTMLYGLGMVDYNAGGWGIDSVQDWYDAADAHEVFRRNEFHNVELNLIRYNLSFASLAGGLGGGLGGRGGLLRGRNACGPGGCNTGNCGVGDCGSCGTGCSPWSGSMFAGARFFKFDEFFSYRSSINGLYNNDIRDMIYDIDVANNLVGFQFGGNVNYALGRCWSVFGGTKLGLYNNHITHYSRIYGSGGNAMPNSGSYAGDPYAVRSSTNSFSFLSEINVGLGYQFSPCWRAVGGYRLLGATGIALAPNQIPNNFSYLPGVAEINNDGSLLLHGAFVGLEYSR
ncbi:MAG TPA: BBP7 family outer membrane beta-barrel protein [Pirellulaceae bacterium]|nr:BBP7 family outer membrane beta-barrel protein [Pirellulaceae bacterium]